MQDPLIRKQLPKGWINLAVTKNDLSKVKEIAK